MRERPPRGAAHASSARSAGDIVEVEGSLRRRFWRSAGRAGQPLRGRRRAARCAGGQSWSASRRITSPDAGFGVNSVDLRGIRAAGRGDGGDRGDRRRPQQYGEPAVVPRPRAPLRRCCARIRRGPHRRGAASTARTSTRCSVVTSRAASAGSRSPSRGRAAQPCRRGSVTTTVRCRRSARRRIRARCSRRRERPAPASTDRRVTAATGLSAATASARGRPCTTRWIACTCGP